MRPDGRAEPDYNTIQRPRKRTDDDADNTPHADDEE